MKRLLYVILPLLLWSCQSDMPAKNETVKQQSVQPTPVNNPPTASAGQSRPEIVGEITLAAEQKTVQAGESFCMKFSVANFLGVLSTQYTLSWDPAVLKFEKLQNFKLPYMNEQDFGLPLAEKGMLTCVWIDDSLRGVTLPDGSPMYEVCFQADEGAAGKSSMVAFVEKPTPFESVNVREKLLQVKPLNGKVMVK